jgi:hypothetical protein
MIFGTPKTPSAAPAESAAIKILAFLAVTLVFFCFANHYIVYDEGLWSYVARVWIHQGIPPYTGAMENKTPGIFLIYTLSTLAGTGFILPRLLAAALLCTGGFCIYRIGTLLADTEAGLWSLAFYSALLALRKTDMLNVGPTDSYLLSFASMAFLLYAARGSRKLRVLYSGLAIGAAIAFKQIAVLPFAALCIWPWLSGLSWREAKADSARIIAGALIVNIAVVLPLLACGMPLRDYFDGAWFSLLHIGTPKALMLGIGRIFPHGPAIQQTVNTAAAIATAATPGQGAVTGRLAMAFHAWAGLLWFLPGVLWFVLDKKSANSPAARKMLLLWLLCDFIGVNASAQYFPHQFKQIIPSLALVCGLSCARAAQLLKLEAAKSRAYAMAFAILFLSGAMMATERRLPQLFSGPDGFMAGMAARMQTKPGDLVYISECRSSSAQFYSERFSPSRYFNTIFIYGQRQQDEVLSALEKKPPELILVLDAAPQWLARYISGNGYKKCLTYRNYEFLRRPDGAAARI